MVSAASSVDIDKEDRQPLLFGERGHASLDGLSQLCAFLLGFG